MSTLTPKQLRGLTLAMQRFLKAEAFHDPVDFNDLKALTKEQRFAAFTQEIRVPGGGRLFPNELGRKLQREIVSKMHEADMFDGLAEYSDVWTAFRDVLKDSLSKGLVPSDGQELLTLVQQKVHASIKTWTFAVAVHGVKLKGLDHLQLGAMTLTNRGEELVASSGVANSEESAPGRMKAMKNLPWLFGSLKGTQATAKRRFDGQARLAAGMLAVAAAATHERGAHAFRIGAVLAAEDSIGPCQSLFWSDADKQLNVGIKFRQSQDYVVSQETVDQFSVSEIFRHAFELLESTLPNELQAAIAKSVFWFADAHRDSLPVMRFVKYWSCVECFFSLSKVDITQNVSIGMASVLTFGGLDFFKDADYDSNKRRIKKLYDQRSGAVHNGLHNHVSDRDVCDLSQWTAWLILCMVQFSASGYKSLQSILDQSRRLDTGVKTGASSPSPPAT